MSEKTIANEVYIYATSPNAQEGCQDLEERLQERKDTEVLEEKVNTITYQKENESTVRRAVFLSIRAGDQAMEVVRGMAKVAEYVIKSPNPRIVNPSLLELLEDKKKDGHE